MQEETFNIIVVAWIALACILFFVLLFITVPYGRHSTRRWGPTIPNRLGWFIMEIPALIIFLCFVLSGSAQKSAAVIIIAILFSAHYTNRSLIYPLRIKTTGKKMPLLIACMAVIFNTVNASIIGYHTGSLQSTYTSQWLTDPRFISGIIVFIAGMAINLCSDEKLIHLRLSGVSGYKIPSGGLFNYISCPNFFGEIVEWAGFALLCWSLPSLSFFVWTVCNLLPRALDHHRWYKKQFPEYPAARKAVLPFIL